MVQFYMPWVLLLEHLRERPGVQWETPAKKAHRRRSTSRGSKSHPYSLNTRTPKRRWPRRTSQSKNSEMLLKLSTPKQPLAHYFRWTNLQGSFIKAVTALPESSSDIEVPIPRSHVRMLFHIYSAFLHEKELNALEGDQLVPPYRPARWGWLFDSNHVGHVYGSK